MKRLVSSMILLTVVTGTFCLWNLFEMRLDVKSFYVLTFLIALSLGPLFISLLIARFCHTRTSLGVLLVLTLFYAWWFATGCHSAYKDEEASLFFVFAALYSLPVMIPGWIIALCKRKNKSNKNLNPISGSSIKLPEKG